MKLKKPKFWDYKKPNLLAYLLLPFSYLVILTNFMKSKKSQNIEKIKTICIGNIYAGGTGKTPLAVKINNLLNNLNFKTAFVKKKYYDQIDEQNFLASKGKLFCEKKRIDALKKAINENILITDEAMAMELSNYKPIVIMGDEKNIKITHKTDLKHLELFLKEIP